MQRQRRREAEAAAAEAEGEGASAGEGKARARAHHSKIVQRALEKERQAARRIKEDAKALLRLGSASGSGSGARRRACSFTVGWVLAGSLVFMKLEEESFVDRLVRF